MPAPHSTVLTVQTVRRYLSANFKMTESEALEVIAAFGANTMSAFSSYLTLTSAYLILCYIIGANLTRFQVVAVSALYFFAALITTASAIGQQQAIAEIQKNSKTVLDAIPIWNMDTWNIGMGLLMGSGILMSLYFMCHTRSRGST